jgi:MoaA/NifB/PqqE/SkfB family radical SAM enzyme
MTRLVIELTNRCNLRCLHCFTERHAATGDLPLPILDTVLHEGKGCGIDHLAFTGGEPTIHRQFGEIIRRVCEAQYTFSLVSNGTNFAQIAPLLQQYRHWFTGVTFSLDGAHEATHDRLRGAGSYRRVMWAASLCVFNDLPFTLNMVLTAQNRDEVEAMVRLATRLGSRPTGTHIWQGLKQGLSLQEISDRLQGVFEVDANGANRSVLAFVNELAQYKLVLIPPQESA